MPRMLCVYAVARPGGAEIGLRRLVERLDGWDVTLAGPDTLPVGGLGRGEGARAIASFARARRLARAHDVVYLNGTVAGRLLPAVAGVTRTVLHVHDLVERVARHWHRADVVLADSEAVADRLHPLGAHVVGCPVVLGRPQAAAPPWPTEPRPVVGYVGRIEPRKGVLDLVAAAPRIGARVVLVGDDSFGADDAYRRRVAASTAVEHVGWVEDAAALMAHLDVLVLPSHAEPFGTVLAEAMAAGTPVVATAVGGLPEVAPSSQLVPPGRPDALAAKVNETLADRERRGREAVARAERWDAGAYAARVESLIAP